MDAHKTILDDVTIRVLVIMAVCLVSVNALFLLLADEILTVDPGRISMEGPFGLFLEQIDLASEANFATWFSSTLLLVNALYAYQQARHLRSSKRPVARTCVILSSGFLLLSLDDIIQLHERAEGFLKRLLVDLGIAGGLGTHIGYVFGGILAIILIVLVAGPYFRAIRRQNYRYLYYTIAFLLVAVLSEMVYDYASFMDTRYSFRIEVLFEEGSEFGAILSFLVLQHREAVALS